MYFHIIYVFYIKKYKYLRIIIVIKLFRVREIAKKIIHIDIIVYQFIIRADVHRVFFKITLNKKNVKQKHNQKFNITLYILFQNKVLVQLEAQADIKSLL